MSHSTPKQVTESMALPQRSLNRQAVLDEDEYTEALSHIIARDFFPSLVHLDATNTYLDALKTENATLINESVRRLQELATPTPRHHVHPQLTPLQTPWGGGLTDTPLRTPHGNLDRPSKRPRYNVDLSLDNFQARYTSEDNSSFTEILDEENRRRKEKWGWAWDAQRRVEAQRGKMLEARERLMIETTGAPGVREKLVIQAPQPAGLITTGEDDGRGQAGEQEGEGEKEEEETGKGALLVNQDNAIERKDDGYAQAEIVDVMAPKKDTRPAGVDGWKFKTRNALMFPPDADMAPYDTPHSASSPAATRGEPKSIKHDNTRLPEQEEPTSSGLRGVSAPPSPTRSRIDAAIAGTPYQPRSPTGNNFSLLPTMPSPTPSELGPAAVKQLMTWGTLNATPRVLAQSNDPADVLPLPSTPFHLPLPSAREVVSHKLSNNAAKSLRARAALIGGSGLLGSRTPGTRRGKNGSGEGSMAPPNWTPRRADAVGSLTPAAKQLLDRTTTGVAGSRRADAMRKTAGWEGSAKAKERDLNRVRWTPSPSPTTRKRA